ncbi:MAG: hypothetical protein QXO00_07095 [Candidatus Bathyarchaeia archaeon]
MRRRMIAILLTIWLLSVLFGCGGGAPPDTTPPTISDVQVNPTSLRFFGGQVTISVQVEDPSGVDKVWSEVQKPREGEN